MTTKKQRRRQQQKQLQRQQQKQLQRQGQQQIPYGDDNQKCKCIGNNNSNGNSYGSENSDTAMAAVRL